MTCERSCSRLQEVFKPLSFQHSRKKKDTKYLTMHCTLKTVCFAVACLAVTSHADATNDQEEVDVTSEDFDYHLYARNALEQEAAAIKAEFGDDVDTTLEGYEHLLFARSEVGANDEENSQSDADFAAHLAKSLAEDDEDCDALPDGVEEADYQKELDQNNAEDNTLPLDRRDAEAKLAAPLHKFVFAPTAAEKKRLGRMKPHYVKHEERVSADLKQFMRRFADDPEGDDGDVDVSLEGYDHELVRRESAGVDDGDNDWEEPEEQLKGYDHSKLLENADLSPEEQAKYLKEWSEIEARDFDVLEDEDEDGDNDRYVGPEDDEDVDAEGVEKRGYTRLQKMRKGVKVLLGLDQE